MKDLKLLQLKMETLTVFNDLFSDFAFKSLYELIKSINLGETNAVLKYSEFVNAVYSCGGNLSEHIKNIVFYSENVFVKTVGKNQPVLPVIQDATKNELKILQEISTLTKLDLTSTFKSDVTFADFETFDFDFEKEYFLRAQNIGKFGYGKYSKNKMFYLSSSGEILPVKNPDSVTLDSLIDYERERNLVIENTKKLILNKPCLNVLLSGDAGTGKSSTVKAVVNEFFADGLRIIEVRKDQLRQIPKLLDELSENPLKFILFIDDLSFASDDDNFNTLKAVLEGSVSAKSPNVCIYATSNRRHIVKEKFSDRDGDDVHINDTLQEIISLSERFGLHITFQRPSKATYLGIIKRLVDERGLDISNADIELLGERFALERGGRSCRLARQFVDNLIK